MTGEARSRQGVGRWQGEAEARFFGVVVGLTDLLPPRIRYGYVHRVTRRLFRRPLRSLAAIHDHDDAGSPSTASTAPSATTCVVLMTDHLDVGGIGSVVEMLVDGLPATGVRPVVICRGDGARARRLRSRGVEVITADSEAEGASAIRRTRPVVIQLHSAPAFLEAASIASGLPLVPVLHNTEIHFPKARWKAFAELMNHAVSAIAVSETVREFHARHLPPRLAGRIVVIGNGAPATPQRRPGDRAAARRALGDTIGRDLGDRIVFACLARYDSQKNIAGMVWSFLEAVARVEPEVLLVIAGDPSDWAELRRADGLRASHASAHRVHLLGNSHPGTLLAAADAFILDSFFEGWPVAATEGASAGLPLLLSEVGGARELVARDPGRSIMVSNPAGSAEAISDASVRRARRRSRHQVNAGEVADAVREISATVIRERLDGGAGSEPPASGSAEMVTAHAYALKAAAQSSEGAADLAE